MIEHEEILLLCIFFFNFILFLNLHNCIRFAKYQNESATGIQVGEIQRKSLKTTAELMVKKAENPSFEI